MTQPKIYTQMAKVMAEVTDIGKDQKNQQQGFKYRCIDDVYNVLNPILAKHSVFMTSHIIDKTREERTNKNGTVLAFTCLRMAYTFWADDGSSVSTEVEGEGMDSGDKSSNKAMAVAHKYALLQAFCIPTKDMEDPDAETHEVKASEAKAKPKAQEKPPAYIERATQIANMMKTIEDVDELEGYWDGLTDELAELRKTNAKLADRLVEVHAEQLSTLSKVAA